MAISFPLSRLYIRSNRPDAAQCRRPTWPSQLIVASANQSGVYPEATVSAPGGVYGPDRRCVSESACRRSAATFEPSLCEHGVNTTGVPPTSGGRHVPTRPLRRTGAPLKSIGDGQHGSAPEVQDSVFSDRPLRGRLRARRTGKLSPTVRHGCRARGAKETSYGPREDLRSGP
jgi:hypothetical protein